MSDIVIVNGLSKTYKGGIKAVDDVSFSVKEGEIFGFLGPNGAGKSTTIMMLTTLVRPTAGSATIAGYDIVKEQARVRMQLGYVSQDLAVDDTLSGLENMLLQARFYHIPKEDAVSRAKELLRLVELENRAGDLAETYSGGMRKRLDIAEGLIHRPRVLFLDEPTLGLDIQTRREVWRYVNELREQENMTIFLTTHYMDEADSLCDRIAIIDGGTIKAIDTPEHLKSQMGGDLVILGLESSTERERDAAVQRIEALAFVREVRQTNGDYMAVVRDGESAVPLIFDAVRDTGVQITKVLVKKPTLDDAFLSHTGRKLREESGSREQNMRSRMIMRRARR